MFRVPPFVVTGTSSVPGAAARRADSMIAPVTVSELFGLTTMIFTAHAPSDGFPALWAGSRRRPSVGSSRVERGAGRVYDARWMRTVLVLQHVPYEGHGYIADYMREHDIPFDVISLWKPYAVPDIFRYSALIVMGGPMSVYEDFPSKNDELAMINGAIGTIPTLGICLGSQLIAHALGARVYPNERDAKPAKEIGYDTVQLTPEGSAHRLFKGFDPNVRVLQWHGDAFD